MPGFSTGAWWGLFGPAHIAEPVVAKIRADAARALATPALQKLYTTNTMERQDMGPEQFVQFIDEDTANWTQQIKAAGIKPQRGQKGASAEATSSGYQSHGPL